MIIERFALRRALRQRFPGAQTPEWGVAGRRKS